MLTRNSLFLGTVNGRPVYLNPRDRSLHILLIGPSGTGKTVSLESLIRQDIDAGRGVCVIDPMGALYDRIVSYFAYRKSIGCKVSELILLNLSDPEWVLPYNPWSKREGELSVQVDRNSLTTMRSWGQHTGDESPRLEKWLRCLYTPIIANNLTIYEASHLLDQRGSEVSNYLLESIADPIIKSRLNQLMRATPREFNEQIESTENRLMRFLCSAPLMRMFGLGQSAIDCRKIMDQGHSLLINARPSNFYSREQQRLVLSFILNQFYETALERPSGASPFYLYLDEAHQFITLELAEALETSRQKGLHFTLSLQHLSQFKELGPRVYKAVKNNVRTKVVFGINDREDALELADDLFADLGEPEVKHMHGRLSHRIEDVREQSITESQGTQESHSHGQSRNVGLTVTDGQSTGRSESQTHGNEQGEGRSRTLTRGKNFEIGTSNGTSDSQNQSHTRGFSESRNWQTQSGRNHSETLNESKEHSLFGHSEERRLTTQGVTRNESRGYSRTDTGSDSYQSGTTRSETTTNSRGGNRSLARSVSIQSSVSSSKSEGHDSQRSHSRAQSAGSSNTEGQSRSQSQSRSVTDQPGTRHIAFIEEDPEFRTLEERRWRASELLMRQKTGHWYVRAANGIAGFGATKLPQKFYMRAKQLSSVTRGFYERHNFSAVAAATLLSERKKDLLRKATSGPTSNGEFARPAWNRAAPALTAQVEPPSNLPKRGPKPAFKAHAEVARLVAMAGSDWRSEEKLIELCEEFDAQKLPVSKNWPTLAQPARSWQGALRFHRDLVVKAIEGHLAAAAKYGLGSQSKN